MITWKQARNGIDVRSSKCLPIKDQYTGRAIDCNEGSTTGHEVLVSWDSGLQTWATRAELFPSDKKTT